MRRSITNCKSKKLVHEWRIKNFEKENPFINANCPLICDWKSDRGESFTTWFHRQKGNIYHVSIKWLSQVQRSYPARVGFYVLECGQVVADGSYCVPSYQKFTINQFSLFQMDLSKFDLSKCFTLRTEIEFCSPNDFATTTEPSFNVDHREMFMEMLYNEAFADCVFKVGEEEIKAHRNILSQNSKVFRAMFSHESTVEATDGIIDIKDSDKKSVDVMLKFMYTGSIVLDDVEAKNVLSLAEKYDLQPLKDACIYSLEQNITQDNVLETAGIGELYQSKILIEKCAEFLTVNLGKISQSEEWKQFKAAHLELAVQLLGLSSSDQ